MKTIFINSEYITLGQFLKISSLIQTGGEAKYFLQNNDVFVNDFLEKRRGRKLYSGFFVQFKDEKFTILEKKWLSNQFH